MEKQERNSLIIASVVLGLHLIIRLIDQSKLLSYFPLDYNNDLSSYMAQLYFLKECGFHNYCSYWYNGFTSFQFSPPGWYFLVYPLYLMLNDVKVVTYIAIVAMFVAGLLLFYYMGRLGNLSKWERVGFFFLFFGNASAVGNFIRLGRVNEMLAWVLFIILFFTFYDYRNKKLDKYFYISIPVYAAIVLSYHSTGVLAAFMWLGFLLTRKSWKERFLVIGAGIVSLALTSFWLVPFVINIFKGSAIPHLEQGKWIWYFGKNNFFNNLAVFVVPLGALIAFFLYYTKSKKEDFILFLPSLILAVLFFLRLSPLLPIFNQIYPDPIVHYFIFLGVFFFLKIDTQKKSKLVKSLLTYGLIGVVVASVAVNMFHTPYFKVPDSVVEQEFISYLPNMKERFVLVGTYPEGPFPKAFYSFAGSEGVPSISGWYPEEKEISYIQRMEVLHKAFNERRCNDFKSELLYFNTTRVLARDEFCMQLDECDLELDRKKTRTCVYKYP